MSQQGEADDKFMNKLTTETKTAVVAVQGQVDKTKTLISDFLTRIGEAEKKADHEVETGQGLQEQFDGKLSATTATFVERLGAETAARNAMATQLITGAKENVDTMAR